MEIAKCSKEDMIYALQQNNVSKADIESALAKQANTLATTANTTATKAQTISEEDALLAEWKRIAGEEAETIATTQSTVATNTDTAATTANTVAKTANLSITNLLRVAYDKLIAVIKANPLVLAISASIAALSASYYMAVKYQDKVLKKTKETAEKSISEYNDTKSEIENLNSELQTSQQRIDELNAKENLSLIEAEELEKLKVSNKELERQIALKDTLAQQQKKSANADAVKYFNTTETSGNYSADGNNIPLDRIDVVYDKLRLIDEYEQKIEETNNRLATDDNLTKAKRKELELFVKSYQKWIDDYNKSIADTITEFMSMDDFLLEGIDDELINRLNELYDYYDTSINGVAQSHTNTISAVLDKADFKNAKTRLLQLGKEGQLSIESLSEKFPDLIEYLDEAGISAKELYQYIMNLANPDAIKYDELKHQLQEVMGFGDGVHTIWAADKDKELQDLGLYENDALEVFASIKAKYVNGETELWSSDDWIKNIQDELNGASVDDIDVSITPTISSSIQQLATQLEPQFAELGEAYQAIFTDDGFTLDDVDNSMLEGLRKSFAEIEEEIGVAFDPSVLNPFFDALTNEASTADQVQQAFNDLATAYFYSTETLEQLNDETADAIEKQLEEMGVSNAHEVVLEALALKNEELAVSKQYLAETGQELASVSELESAAFIASATAAGTCSQQFAALQLQKILCNENWLDSTTDINGLLMLAEAAGIAGNAILQLYGLKQGYDTAVANHDSNAAIAINNQMQTLKTQIANELANIGTDVKLDFGKIGGGKSAASKAGKDAGEAYADALKDELSKLNDVIGAIGDIINNQIDLYEDQKDAAVEALEAQKEAAEEALEAEKALVQEQIDAKQDEIDKIKEAAKERKNEIDLQKAQYDLARMQNQRTLLIYSEDKGMHYVQDTKEIRSAKEAVTEAQENIQIAGLEKEISGLEDIIDSLDKKIEESNKYYDDLIEQTEKYWDSLIKGLEDYKSRWDELAEIEEQAKVLVLLEQMGISTNDVLSMSESAFQGFKESYTGLLTEMYKDNDKMLESLSKVAGVDMSSLNGYLIDAKNSIDDLKNADLSNLSDSFDNVTASAGNTSNAINGSGGSSTKSSGSGNQATGSSSGTGDSLKAAIKDETESAIEDLTAQKELFNGDKGLTNAVQEVIDKIGGSSGGEGSAEGSQESEGDSNNLTSALKEQTAQALNEETGIPAQKRAWEELDEPLDQAEKLITTIRKTLEDLDGRTFTVTLNVEGNGGSIASGGITGVFGGVLPIRGNVGVNGTAHIKGSANAKGNWGAKKGGRTLVGELGQELWVHSADGTFETVGNNGAEFINIKPNDIIFNHLQTKQLLDKGNIIGRGKVNGGALANGTASGKSVNTIDDIIITADGKVLKPLDPSDKMYDVLQKFNTYMASIDNNVEKLVPNSMYERNKQMHETVTQIMNSNITNNKNIQPSVTVGDIYVTCPGVTSQQVAEQLGNALDIELNKKFSGFHNLADQYSRIR